MSEGIDVPPAPANAPKVDPSRVKFLLVGTCDKNMFLSYPSRSHGIVDKTIDLSDDITARQLLQMGFTFILKCPAAKYPVVLLRPGDPTTFTDAWEGFGFSKGSLLHYPVDLVEGALSERKPGVIAGYRNFPQAFKKQQAYYAEQERQRNAELEKKRQAQQRMEERWAAFVKANKVTRTVGVQALTANPFVYQGQVVAITCRFERMNSATQGIFSDGDYKFVVSSVPTTMFTQSERLIAIAGRVLGNIEIKPGITVPHLSFVGLWVP